MQLVHLLLALLLESVPERAVERLHRVVHGRLFVGHLLTRRLRRVHLVDELDDGRNLVGVEVVILGVHRHAHAASLGVDAKRRLEKVVHVLGHLHVQPGVDVREDDLVHALVQSPLIGSALDRFPRLVHALHEFVPLLHGVVLGSSLPRRLHFLSHVRDRDHREHRLGVLVILQQLLLGQVRLPPVLLQLLERALEARVERVGHVDALHESGGVGALVHGEVLGDRRARLVGQLPGALVAHPTVDTASAGVDPEEVVEPEVFPQALVDDLHGDVHEGPALVADVRRGAARAHVVVVGHVDVHHELPLGRREHAVGPGAAGVRQPLARVHVEHGPDIDLARELGLELLAQLLVVLEGLVSDEDVAREGEAELAALHETRVRLRVLQVVAVREPLHHGLGGEERVVVDPHVRLVVERHLGDLAVLLVVHVHGVLAVRQLGLLRDVIHRARGRGRHVLRGVAPLLSVAIVGGWGAKFKLHAWNPRLF